MSHSVFCPQPISVFFFILPFKPSNSQFFPHSKDSLHLHFGMQLSSLFRITFPSLQHSVEDIGVPIALGIGD